MHRHRVVIDRRIVHLEGLIVIIKVKANKEILIKGMRSSGLKGMAMDNSISSKM